MITIYVDADYRGYIVPASDRNPVETDMFDGKCQAYIEGYRFVPAGESWTRQDGEVFHGELVFPWKDWQELDAAQRKYERELLEDYEQALSEIEAKLGVSG